MSLESLPDPAKLAISEPQKPGPTDCLWTSRSPVLLPPSPVPGQHDVPIYTRSSSPLFPRYRFGLCANKNGDIYFYGGVTDGRRDELYHYSIADNAVTPLQCLGASPGSRYSHAMTSVGNLIAIHGGGSSGSDDPGLYVLNLVSRQWSKISTSGDAPGNLRRHAMAAVGTTIYIFGGFDLNYVDSDKLWAFNFETLHAGVPRWELIEPLSHVRPTARYSSTLVPYHDRLILFSGLGEGSIGSDVWSFDTKHRRWSELRCTGNIPPQRFGHTATVLDDVMYIIAGESMGSARVKDVFTLKIPEQRWSKLRDTDTMPLPRYHHASTRIGTTIFIFGGDLGKETEEHPIHILDANYINDPNLHTSERLKEIDIEFPVTIIQEKKEKRREEDAEHETETSQRRQIISHILKYSLKMESLAQLQRPDAQMIVDFLEDELGRQDILQSNTDRRHILHFFSKLAKSTQVFPKSTELSDVHCALAHPVNDEGGYGFIYKGTFKGQVVCVKAVRAVGYSNRHGKMLQMLRAQAGEVVLLAQVSHPNVIPLYGVYLSNEEIPRTCIVSPWMENGDLVAYLDKFPNTPQIPFACDITAGLDFLHDMGIIHADLKARNVLVSRSRRAMLADFGIATILHTNVGTTTAGDFSGTTYWMAPELLIALADDQPPPPTKQSDMWGFACICYEMSTGEIPFIHHYKPMQLAMAFVKGRRITPLRPNQDIDPIGVAASEPWVPLAERCWNFDPSERPTAAEALRFLVELNAEDDRPSMNEELSTFKAIKDSRVKVNVDYSRVLSIVRNT